MVSGVTFLLFYNMLLFILVINMQDILKNCSFVFEELEKSGFECFAVGGCVRDILLNTEPNDIDFTTNAKPDEILECFKDYETFELGKKYGTISVLKDDKIYEITTFRVDGKYSDSRHPDGVQFSRSLYDDLSRRDFTINAMAMDKNGNITDIFSGKKDLKNKIIRTVGKPDERFSEDALRIFRALRFSCKLGFEIEKSTAKAIKNLSHLLVNVHPQRIRDELTALLLTDKAPDIISEYREVFFCIIPELKKTEDFRQITAHHRYDVFIHTLNAIKFAPYDAEIRFALLFHDIAKPDCHTTDKAGISHFNGHPSKSADIAAEILKRFAFHSEFVNKVSLFIRYHDKRFEKPRLHIKKLLSVLNEDDFRKLLTIQRCDVYAQSDYLKTEKLAHIEYIESQLSKIIAEKPCIKLSELAVDGNDLLSLGFNGKEIGNTLNKLLELVIEEKINNDKDALLKKCKELISGIDK